MCIFVFGCGNRVRLYCRFPFFWGGEGGLNSGEIVAYAHAYIYVTCLGENQGGQGPERRQFALAVDEEDEDERGEVDAEEDPLRCVVLFVGGLFVCFVWKRGKGSEEAMRMEGCGSGGSAHTAGRLPRPHHLREC